MAPYSTCIYRARLLTTAQKQQHAGVTKLSSATSSASMHARIVCVYGHAYVTRSLGPVHGSCLLHEMLVPMREWRKASCW